LDQVAQHPLAGSLVEPADNWPSPSPPKRPMPRPTTTITGVPCGVTIRTTTDCLTL